MPPAKVRLITGDKDPYVWKIYQGNEYLFAKNMSKQQQKHIYIELLEKVGSGFEAVSPSAEQNRRDHPVSVQLHAEKTTSQNDIHKLRQRLESISAERDRFQYDVETLRLQNTQLITLINLLTPF